MATADSSGHLARARQQLADTWERETETTLRVLRAYPPEKIDLRPSDKSKPAGELAWMFSNELLLAQGAIQGELDFGIFQSQAPDDMAAIIRRFEENRRSMLDALRSATDEQMAGTTKFFVAPQKMGDIPNEEFLWFLLHDQIHHRGQFSVYLRMAGGRLPSIYGPTADEPWR